MASVRQLLAKANSTTEDIKWFFDNPELLFSSEHISWKACVVFVFSEIERAHGRCLYAGLIKKHRTSATLTKQKIAQQHFTKENFRKFFKTVFGESFPVTLTSKIKGAEKTRNDVAHGKNVTDKRMRQALYDMIEYAEAFNEWTNENERFRPFGDLRGVKGRGAALNAKTTFWVLKGMGFSAKMPNA